MPDLEGEPVLVLIFLIPRQVFQRRQWHSTPVLLPGKSHRRRSLVGCSPWGREESDTTDRLHFHFSLSCIGEGNGNPLQYSCLENPRNRGAWWAAVYGVAQSRTWLKRLSSSSSQQQASVAFTMGIKVYLIQSEREVTWIIFFLITSSRLWLFSVSSLHLYVNQSWRQYMGCKFNLHCNLLA